MTHNSTVNLKLIHFLLWAKGSYQSSNFDTFECSGENLQNSSCHFPSNKSVFFQILHHSSMSWKIASLYFFSSNNIYFAQKEPIKMKIFGTFFECSGQNLWNFLSILKRQVDSSPNFVSLFSFMKDYSSVLFSSNNTYFAQKEPIKVNMFETFECSGQILLNSLCQFWNKSIPLQILSKFCVSLQFHERYVLYTFLAQTIYTFSKGAH